MSVRLIAGRAGTGKTHFCLEQICQALAHGAADGPRLVMLVPEQAALQIERGILGMLRGAHSAGHGTPVLGRCEVLGFRRLAHRILNETPGKTPVVLSANGRQMALRHLLNKHHKEFKEFSRVAQRTGFIRMVAQGMSTLLQECASGEQLARAAEEAESRNDASARRLHDLALIYRVYLEYLGDERVDPEGVLDLARGRLQRSAWLRDAQIWIDGFAGFTQQQARMIVELASRSSHVDLALLLDPAEERSRQTDTLSLFARTQQTWTGLWRALEESGIAIDPPVLLDKPPMRFAGAPTIARIERGLFRMRHVDGVAWTSRDVRMVIAPDRRGEVAAVAREVLDLVQRRDDPMRFRNIAIIVRDLGPYHDLLSAELRAHGIPFFIDRRRPTHHHPLVTFVRAALAMHVRAAFGPALISMLKTGLGPLSDDEVHRLENYVLAYGLVSVESWNTPWSYAVQPGREKNQISEAQIRALEELNALRTQVISFLGDWLPQPASPGHPHAGTWLTRLYGLLDRCGVPGRIGQWHEDAMKGQNLDVAAEHQQVWSDLCGLFDELHEALGEESMTPRQFTECLEAGLAEFTLGLVPATLDQVLVSSIERSRHPPIKAAFVLGMTDQDFPARIDDDELLGDAEKSALASVHIDMGRLRAERILDERMLAYVAFTRPSDLLWVSYPRTDQAGKPMLASPYWEALRAVIPDVAIVELTADAPEDISTVNALAGSVAQHLREECEAGGQEHSSVWTGLYEWARQTPAAQSALGRAVAALAPAKAAVLTAESCAMLWPVPYKTSVSALEDYAACPFRHYARRGLRLEQRPVHELSSVELGRLYHAVLQQFVNELIETKKTLRDFSDDAIAARVSHYCETVLPTMADAKGLDEPARRLALWRGRAELGRAVRAQKKTIAGSPLDPRKTELSFGMLEDDPLPALKLQLDEKRSVLLRGVIDRVDLLQSEGSQIAVVYDYKRSGVQKRLRLGDAYHGLALQLLAYLLVIRDCGRNISGVELLPGGAFYLPLLGPPKKVDHPSEADADDFSPFDDFRPRGVIDFDHIQRLEPTLSGGRSGVFSVAINKDGGPGHVDTTDVVYGDGMNRLLDHVRSKMVELARSWLSGDISVQPFKLGEHTPCGYCEMRGVCRMEYVSRSTRHLESLSRREVIERLGGAGAPPEAAD